MNVASTFPENACTHSLRSSCLCSHIWIPVSLPEKRQERNTWSVYPVESENSDGALKVCKGKGNQKNVSQVNASPGGSGGKVSACKAETQVQSLGWEDSPGEENGNPL